MQRFIPGRLERVTEHLQRHYIEPRKIAGCQTLVAVGGEVAYTSELGHADLARDRPLASDTIFRIYSMTKPITSVALMMLYERGLFQLNEAVTRILPEWRDQRVWVSGEGDSLQTEAPKRPVTFRDLLCHTGGLTYGNLLAGIGAPESVHPVDDIYAKLKVRRSRDETLADLIEKLGRVPLRYQPGEHWMYSLSTDVCGALVERLSGQRFDKFLAEHIFGPLGMKDTGFFVPEDKLARFAACYRRAADKSLQLTDDPQTSQYRSEPKFFSGGGGLVSTLADYHKFCEMLRRGGEYAGARILGPQTLRMMHANHLPNGQQLTDLAIGTFAETRYDGVGFGLGFASTVDKVKAGSACQGEFYWGGAASTTFWVDPREDLVVVFMTQLVPSATFDFRGQLRSLVYSALAK